MKLRLFFLVALLWLQLIFLLAEEAEAIAQISRQAKALWEAGDYTAASALYESLLQQPLPVWQRARVLYNLGTLRLAEHQPSEALALFQEIHPTDLSLPRFARNLLMNEGIAYFQQAQALALSPQAPISLGRQALFIEKSLQTLHEAQRIDCHIQQEEQKDLKTPCSPNPLINQWIKKIDQFPFFLLEGFSLMDAQINAKENPLPVSILRPALEEADRVLLWLLFYESLPEKSPQRSSLYTLLKNRQQEILNRVKSFHSAVIEQQKINFQQETSTASRCQQSPWDLVVPLFEHGYQMAKSVEKQFATPSFNPSETIAKQEQTVDDWQRALDLLLHPPQQKQRPGAANKDLNETFRLIQEMYLEDQPRPPEVGPQELHTW